MCQKIFSLGYPGFGRCHDHDDRRMHQLQPTINATRYDTTPGNRSTNRYHPELCLQSRDDHRPEGDNRNMGEPGFGKPHYR